MIPPELTQRNMELHMLKQIAECAPARPCAPDNRVLVASLKAQEREAERTYTAAKEQMLQAQADMMSLRSMIRMFDESEKHYGAL